MRDNSLTCSTPTCGYQAIFVWTIHVSSIYLMQWFLWNWQLLRHYGKGTFTNTKQWMYKLFVRRMIIHHRIFATEILSIKTHAWYVVHLDWFFVLIPGEVGMRQQKLTWIVVINFFAINLYHHSHFLAAPFDFTTFFTLAILNKVHIFYSQAVFEYI